MRSRGIVWILTLSLICGGCSQNTTESPETSQPTVTVSAAEWQRKIDAVNGQLVATQQALSDAQVEVQRLQALLESQTERLNDQLASITALEQDLANERGVNQLNTSRWESLKSQLQNLQRQWQELNLKFPELTPANAAEKEPPVTDKDFSEQSVEPPVTDKQPTVPGQQK